MQGTRSAVPDLLVQGGVIPFQIITADRQVVDVCARVIHVQAKSNAFFRIGVQFVSLFEGARAHIMREIGHARQ